MNMKNKNIPYEKNIVINALYDVIEVLGLCLDSSNSARGTLIISEPGREGRIRIALDVINTKHTWVSVFHHDGDDSVYETWSIIILDELMGMIERARHFEKTNNNE